MNWLLEPLGFEFMQQALIIGLLVSIPAATMSCLLVLKGWSLMGDAVSHAVLPGIVIAFLLGIPAAIGAFVAGLFCAIATGFLDQNSRLKEDTVMGVVFSGMFALGLILFNYVHTNLHLDEILFGNILGVSWQDVLETGTVTALVLTIFLIRSRDIMLFAFDPQQARIIGINTRFLHYLLLVMLSMVIVASMKAVGIILVIAVLIAPGAIAFLLTDRFDQMLLIAILIALFCTFTGVILSYHLNSATAPTIVVLMSLAFIVAFLFAPKRGVLKQKSKNIAIDMK